jgi:Glucosyl transferase GtrII
MSEPAYSRNPSGSPAFERLSWFNDRSERATFIISFVLLGLVLLPICIADRYHLEDWRRLLDGRFGWTGEGRPLTELLMTLLNFGRPFKDLSPLPQLAALIVLSYNAVLISRKFSMRSPVLAALIAFPIGASPFFLENLSFRFDSLGMALAIILALVPVLVLVVVVVLGAVVLEPICWIAGALGPVLFPVSAIITLPRIHVGIGALVESSFALLCATVSQCSARSGIRNGRPSITGCMRSIVI